MKKGEQGSSMIIILIIVVLAVVGAVVLLGGSSDQPAATDTTPGAALESNTGLPGGLDAIESAEEAVSALEEKSAAVMEEKEGDAMMEESHSIDTMEAMEKTDEVMKNEEESAMMEKEESQPAATAAPAPAALAAGTFTNYSADQLVLADSGDVVLFFHAEWCPTCRRLESDINANTVPDGVHILKVDYDSETALKQKYGVTRQHTLVVVDSSGNKIKTITTPTNTLAQVVAAI